MEWSSDVDAGNALQFVLQRSQEHVTKIVIYNDLMLNGAMIDEQNIEQSC